MHWTVVRAAWVTCLAVCFLPFARLGGAERWQMQYFYDKNESTLAFADLQFPTARHGIAAGIVFEQRSRKGVAAVTSDGGKTWDLTPLREPPLSLFFLDERAGWMVSERGRLWKTADAGRTWTRAETRGVRVNALRVFFLDETRGWLLCAEKQVYRTSDGGRSWELLPLSRTPDVPPDRSFYTWAAFFQGQVGLLTGWSRLSDRRSALPPWMEPDLIPLGHTPTDAMVLHSDDGGKTWRVHLLERFGEIVRARFTSAESALLLVRRRDSFSVPSSVVALDLKTFRGQSLYADKNRWLTDLASAGPGRWFAAAVDQEGRTPTPAIPGKVRVLESADGRTWKEMDVDYRAEGRQGVFAIPDPTRAWLATDTGMILHWAKE